MKHSCTIKQCEHKSVKYCKACRQTYCEDCNEQWNSPCILQHYFPFTYTPTTTVGSTGPIPAIGNQVLTRVNLDHDMS